MQRIRSALPVLVLLLAGCEQATLPLKAGTGPNPTLPPPNHNADADRQHRAGEGLAAGGKPTAAAGLAVAAFATGLDHPRWLYVLPNGDVLVAETNAPPKPEDGKGIRGWVMELVMKRAGAGVPSANRITLLRDADGDGVAETRTVFLAGPQLAVRHGAGRRRRSTSPTPTRSCAFPTPTAQTRITRPGEKVADLPGGPINHHWTKNVDRQPRRHASSM